ncbi:MAG: gamma-butyrobetaine hydroxylase-like domain-containing protein [Methylophilaceae bacterium]|tara:strand:+ start:158 stop:523 length:366 start_codon:yes stop_codon:yes gene_type:complete
MANIPSPKEIKLHQKSRLLEIQFDDNTECMLSCEMLRVYSPSAEVQGHSPDQAVLQVGKEDINIIEINPVGNYAIKIKFSDGHDTGLFSWSYLHHLAKNYEQLWLEYLGKLDAQGIKRKNS